MPKVLKLEARGEEEKTGAHEKNLLLWLSKEFV